MSDFPKDASTEGCRKCWGVRLLTSQTESATGFKGRLLNVYSISQTIVVNSSFVSIYELAMLKKFLFTIPINQFHAPPEWGDPGGLNLQTNDCERSKATPSTTVGVESNAADLTKLLALSDKNMVEFPGRAKNRFMPTASMCLSLYYKLQYVLLESPDKYKLDSTLSVSLLINENGERSEIVQSDILENSWLEWKSVFRQVSHSWLRRKLSLTPACKTVIHNCLKRERNSQNRELLL